MVIARPDQVARIDLTEYLAYLGSRQLSGVSRARKLAAIREYFRFLEEHTLIARAECRKIDRGNRLWG